MINIRPIKLSLIREQRIGTRMVDKDGVRFRYVKIDFGIMGKDEEGKVYRHIEYGWLPTR